MRRAIGLVLATVISACGGGSALPTATQATGTQGSPATSRPTEARAHVTIKLVHQWAPGAPNFDQMKLFAEEVAKRSKGEMEIVLFPANQLYATENESVPAVQRGEVQMLLTTNAGWAALTPAVNVLDLPFRFASWQDVHAAVDGKVGGLLSDAMQQKGIKTLASFDNSTVAFIGTRDRLVKSPNEIKGLRLRTFSEAVSETYIAWGAAPTNISAAETYSAAQRGIIDGALSGLAFYDRKWYEVMPYITFVPAQFGMLWLQANLAFWNGLAPDQQAVLSDAAKAVQQVNRAATPADEAAKREKMRGLVKGWYEVTPAEIPAWKASVAEKVDAWYRKNGSDLATRILEALK